MMLDQLDHLDGFGMDIWNKGWSALLTARHEGWKMRVDPIDVADGSGCNKGATVENNAKEEWSWLDGLENMTCCASVRCLMILLFMLFIPSQIPLSSLESILCLRLVLTKSIVTVDGDLVHKHP
jgi:hypothetical protein